jgi:hypothetical protein
MGVSRKKSRIERGKRDCCGARKKKRKGITVHVFSLAKHDVRNVPAATRANHQANTKEKPNVAPNAPPVPPLKLHALTAIEPNAPPAIGVNRPVPSPQVPVTEVNTDGSGSTLGYPTNVNPRFALITNFSSGYGRNP